MWCYVSLLWGQILRPTAMGDWCRGPSSETEGLFWSPGFLPLCLGGARLAESAWQQVLGRSGKFQSSGMSPASWSIHRGTVEMVLLLSQGRWWVLGPGHEWNGPVLRLWQIVVVGCTAYWRAYLWWGYWWFFAIQRSTNLCTQNGSCTSFAPHVPAGWCPSPWSYWRLLGVAIDWCQTSVRHFRFAEVSVVTSTWQPAGTDSQTSLDLGGQEVDAIRVGYRPFGGRH